MVNESKGEDQGNLRLIMAAAAHEPDESREKETSWWLNKKGVVYPMPDPEDEARSIYYIYTGKGVTILGPALD